MTTSVDTTTKLSYLLPTGTFLTFQVIAPLATNNGKCGLTEKVLTGVTLSLLVMGCILTSFTDSYTAPDGKVYNGFLTWHGLWVPGYDATEVEGSSASAEDQEEVQSSGDDHVVVPAKLKSKKKQYIGDRSKYKLKVSDYLNAALSSIAFLTLTLFTDPVSTCFYPNMSETLLKTLPVLLAAVLSFFCSFSGKVRHGYGNSYPAQKDPPNPPLNQIDHRVGTTSKTEQLIPPTDETRIHIK